MHEASPADEVYIWHVWPSRRYPSSALEEQRLVRDLAAAGKLPPGKILQHERGDATTVLNALRLGLSFVQLLAVAPGLKPDRLLSAYRHLDRLRERSIEAFTALLDEPTPSSVLQHSQHAAALMPVPTFHLMAGIDASTARERARVLADTRRQLAAARRVVAEQEAHLLAADLDDLSRIRIGRVLYDPYMGGLWSHPYYTPMRVGTMVPDRVRDLLGERD